MEIKKPYWKFGPMWGCYCTDKEIDRDKIERDIKDLLAKATKGKEWSDLNGIKHIPLIVNGQIVGNIWKEADLKSLKVGAYWTAKFGIKAELVNNKEVIGVIWSAE
jgi:hypothetical protein